MNFGIFTLECFQGKLHLNRMEIFVVFRSVLRVCTSIHFYHELFLQVEYVFLILKIEITSISRCRDKVKFFRSRKEKNTFYSGER